MIFNYLQQAFTPKGHSIPAMLMAGNDDAIETVDAYGISVYNFRKLSS
ncbi:MAG: hypothetical protein IKH01_13330 [Prevotella sp.]|nr:hypothetical protein [Prevotella sp.]